MTLSVCSNLPHHSSDVNWTWVDEQTKKEIGLQARDDGEFWMSYRDFCKQFQEVTICQYGPNFDGTGTVDKFGNIWSNLVISEGKCRQLIPNECNGTISKGDCDFLSMAK